MNNNKMHAYIQAAVNVMFSYMKAKKGIKFFGEKAIAVMINYFNKLDEATVVIPLKPDEFTDA